MSPNRNNILRVYQKNRNMGMTPMDKILHAYTKGMQAAEKGDDVKLRRILEGLISSLDFSKNPIVPAVFLKLYRHCLAILDDKRYMEIRRILLTLRSQFLKAAVQK